MNSLGKFHFHIIYILYTPTYTPQSERDFLSKGKCLLWAKWPVRRSVRRRRAYRRTIRCTARRTGPITEHLFCKPFRRRPGGPAGSPARRPVRRTIRRLARRRRTYRRNGISSSQRLLSLPAYIYLSPTSC